MVLVFSYVHGKYFSEWLNRPWWWWSGVEFAKQGRKTMEPQTKGIIGGKVNYEVSERGDCGELIYSVAEGQDKLDTQIHVIFEVKY